MGFALSTYKMILRRASVKDYDDYDKGLFGEPGSMMKGDKML